MTKNYLTVREVAENFNVTPNTVWRWVRNKSFPEPINLTKGCKRWPIADIRRHEETLMNQRQHTATL